MTDVVIPFSLKTVKADAFDGCNALQTVYYGGTVTNWSKLSVATSGNAKLRNATRYYYTEEQPATTGNYWHFVDNTPTLW